MMVWFKAAPWLTGRLWRESSSQRRKAQKTQLPTLADSHRTRCLGKATDITEDCSHPGSSLFTQFPSGKHYRAIKARTSTLINCFYPKAISKLNARDSRLSKFKTAISMWNFRVHLISTWAWYWATYAHRMLHFYVYLLYLLLSVIYCNFL